MMRRWLVLALLIASFAPASAEQNPHAAFVYPAGGQRGTSFIITVGGQFLEEASQAVFAGEGVKAEVISFQKPLPGKESDELRNRLTELEQSHGNAPRPNANPAAAPAPQNNANAPKPANTQPNSGNSAAAPGKDGQKPPEPQRTPAPWTPEDRQLAAELHRQLDQSARMRSAPALSQWVTLKVTIAPNAALGVHELRLLTAKGLTNPMVFEVDRLPEVTREYQFVQRALAAGGGLPLGPQAHAGAAQPPQTIQLPAILNGQMMPGGVDSYRFHARKGQRIVIAAQTRTLIPFMADAVPGWFQAMLTLTDASGKELAATDHFRFSQEPVLAEEIPADGDYTLAVRDIINRGREDFVYRITIGQIPFVSGIFPQGGRAGAAPHFALNGWNLGNISIKPVRQEPGVNSFFAGDQGWNVSSLAYHIGDLPELVEANPASDAAHARFVDLPKIINGRIARPGAVCFFRFNAGAGEEIVAEVEARRLGSPLDSTLALLDEQGHQLAFNDDAEDKGSALVTHQADSRLSYRFSAKGSYVLRIADSQGNGGPDFSYRLRISHPRPDFDVRIAPSSINLRPGRTAPATILLLRRDGFKGPVKLRILDGPRDLQLSGGEIPSGADSVRAGLTAPADAIASPHRLVIEAEAPINGQTVRHQAVPIDDSVQAFAWHEAVPADQAMVWIVGKEHRKPVWTAEANRLKLPAGGSSQLRLQIPQGMTNTPIIVTLNDPPAGIAIASVNQNGNSLQVAVQADAKSSRGLAGNLILEASTKNSAGKSSPPETLPAVPFEVVSQHP